MLDTLQSSIDELRVAILNQGRQLVDAFTANPLPQNQGVVAAQNNHAVDWDMRTNWLEIKAKLMKKYMPSNFVQKICDAAYVLWQGILIVNESMEVFEELKIKGQIVEDPKPILAQFKAGFRANIKRELLGKDL
ncbi:unnamed protein product [Dovyalis caffra]|uniref:Uncharacterized protein n=1 Tax=Dovyalis caffra TaxID=77055 RepID=A0AAV1SEF4_9ROSI|nr:unnamed protein product [Dovyalis caffra]